MQAAPNGKPVSLVVINYENLSARHLIPSRFGTGV
jgi:hypothetical protein